MNLAELRAFKPQIMAIASQYGVREIKVFGSVARGDENENSDVDLLIDNFDGSLFGKVSLKNEIEDLLHTKVDLVQIEAIKNPLRKKYMLENVVFL